MKLVHARYAVHALRFMLLKQSDNRLDYIMKNNKNNTSKTNNNVTAAVTGADGKQKAIYFDMDGTIADLYGVDNWLQICLAGSAAPYRNARPMFNRDKMKLTLASLKSQGWHIGVISWLFMGASTEYDAKVTTAKQTWLRQYMPELDEVIIAPYGQAKAELASVKQNAILVDDDKKNLAAWNDKAANRTSIDASNHAAMFAALNMLAFHEDEQ